MKKIIIVIAVLISQGVVADDLIMVRSPQKFPEAMLALQTSLSDHGYTITHVQRIDIGLTGMGYKTDKYRIVFFAKPEQIKKLSAEYPELMSYLPPKISIFSEGDETLMVTTNPVLLAQMIEGGKYKAVFSGWRNDLYSIFSEIRDTE